MKETIIPYGVKMLQTNVISIYLFLMFSLSSPYKELKWRLTSKKGYIYIGFKGLYRSEPTTLVNLKKNLNKC